jgi:hypothetical protein
MEEDRLIFPESDGQESAENIFLPLPGCLDGKIEADLSEGHATGEFFFNEFDIGFEVGSIQAPRMKSHRRKDKVRKAIGRLEDRLIGCLVRPHSDDRLDPGILSPFQGSFEVWDLIQVRMGVDEPQNRLLPLSMLPHYAEPGQEGQGISAFPCFAKNGRAIS